MIAGGENASREAFRNFCCGRLSCGIIHKVTVEI